MAATESGDAVNSLSQNVETSPRNASGPHGKSYTAIMDDSLFFKAVEGDTEAFEQYIDCLDQLVTPNDDSILHICITGLPFPDREHPTAGNDKFINLAKWVAKSCPDLLRKQNKKGNTPLHIAARHEHLDIAIELVKLCEISPENDQEKGVVGAAAAREMIAMKNEDRDTALHEAIRLSTVYDQLKLSQLLILLTQEQVTALLLANEDKRKALIKQEDQVGWIPLHYAADFGYRDIVQLLLQDDRSVAYTPTNDGNKIDKEEAVTYILNHRLLKNLINKKNAQGSTPLHMLADLVSFMESFVTHPQVDKLAFNDRNLNVLDLLVSVDGLWGQKRKRFVRCVSAKLNVSRGWRIAIQKDEVKIEGSDKVNDDIMDHIKDAREAHLVVATLIATVTFAAGFTSPGGYKAEGGPDEGGAILTRRTAFQAFIITDTIAMMLSSTAVFIHFVMALKKSNMEVYLLFRLTVELIIVAMFAMVVAFITGTYAVLLHTPSLAISTCVIGCFSGMPMPITFGFEGLVHVTKLFL
ncbi:hypothetical protein K2173_006465 [Erythroxylum novogranatense]|uniref:PGG domain-containing protein n=1 Tax=Erythroxylum novogranatense TaxID=1862640 RepID=A0AAV8TD51_9ROSI|nr:hypothetical protein K2173_006465 [Erythroxylum novogranatense]